MSIRFPIDVYLALGADPLADPTTWTWNTDITAFCYIREGGCVIERGRGPWQQGARPASCTLLLNNRDGRFSRLNPSGAYFGSLDLNTPIRVRIDSGGGFVTRFVGLLSELPTRWSPGHRDMWVSVRADGVRRRLGRGKTALSALHHTVIGANNAAPVAYWPLEESDRADHLNSGLPGISHLDTPRRHRLVFSTPPAPGSSGGVGVVGLQSDDAHVPFLIGQIPAGTTGFWSVAFAVYGSRPDDDCALAWKPVEVTLADGDVVAPLMQADFVAGVADLTVTGVGVLGTSLPFFGEAGIDTFNDEWHSIRVTQEQDSTNIVTTLHVDGVEVASDTRAGTVSVPVSWRGLIAQVGSLPSGAIDNTGSTVALSHVMFHDGDTSTWVHDAMTGYVGELAGARYTRLCAEDGVTANVVGTDVVPMGPQPVGRLLTLLDECEVASGGLQVERRDGRMGLDLATARENATVALALDYAQRHIFPPTGPDDDDRNVVNDVTATNSAGDHERVSDETHAGRVGRYDDQISVNVVDDDLPYAAGWRVNLGTAPGYRWSTVTLPVHAPSLAALRDDIAALDVSQRLTIANPPAGLPPDLIDLITEGYSERFDQSFWEITFNANPFSPYRIFRLADDLGDTDEFVGWLLPDTCYLVDAVDSDDTSWLVHTDPPLDPQTDNFPVTVVPALANGRPSGERASVTAAASVATENFGGTSVDSWGTAATGQTWQLIGTAADFDEGSNVGTISPSTLGSDRIAYVDVGCPDHEIRVLLETNTVPSGGVIRYGLAGRVTDSANHYRMVTQVTTTGQLVCEVSRRAGGTLTVLRSTATNFLITADNYFVKASLVGARLRLKVWPQSADEPAVWNIDVTDDTPLTTGDGAGCFGRRETGNTTPTSLDFDLFRVDEPKVWTVTRSTNTVVKSHAAGVTIDIDEPGVLGL